MIAPMITAVEANSNGKAGNAGEPAGSVMLAVAYIIVEL
jgi:hypothetical protein